MAGCDRAGTISIMGIGGVDRARKGDNILSAFSIFYLHQFLSEHYALYFPGAVFCGIDYLEAMVCEVAQEPAVRLVFFTGRGYGCGDVIAGVFCIERYGIS